MNKDGREQAKQSDYGCQHPGSFFQYIGGLLDAHQLIAETSYISCQTTTFGVLYQNDQSEEHTSYNNQ